MFQEQPELLAEHFLNTARTVKRYRFCKDREDISVFDIGSNDGTQLAQYKSLGFKVLGVESCERIAKLAQANGIDTVIDYFNEEVVGNLQRKFDVISASGVFFHLEGSLAARGKSRTERARCFCSSVFIYEEHR